MGPGVWTPTSLAKPPATLWFGGVARGAEWTRLLLSAVPALLLGGHVLGGAQGRSGALALRLRDLAGSPWTHVVGA